MHMVNVKKAYKVIEWGGFYIAEGIIVESRDAPFVVFTLPGEAERVVKSDDGTWHKTPDDAVNAAVEKHRKAFLEKEAKIRALTLPEEPVKGAK